MTSLVLAFVGMKRRLANTNADEAVDEARVTLSSLSGLRISRIPVGQQCNTAYPTD